MLTPSAPSGVTFNWYDAASNGNLLFSGSTFTTPTLNSNTTYYVESENGSGCKSTRTSVTVTIDAAPSSPTVGGTSICSGQTAMLTPSAPSGVTFNWYDAASNGNLLFSGSTFTTPTLNSNTTYYVESENGSGCKSTRTSVTVTIDQILNFSLGNDTLLCTGQILTLNQNIFGATYLWNNGSTLSSISISSSGTFWLEVTKGSCSKRDSINVQINSSGISVNLGPDLPICSGQNILLSQNISGVSYLWSNGSTLNSINISNSGLFWLEVTKGSCTNRDSIVITPSSGLIFNLGNDTTLCNGQTLNLSTNIAGANYLWSNGSTNNSISISSPGIYSLFANIGSCNGIDSINVGFGPADPVTKNPIICYNTSTTLIPSFPTGVTFNWYTNLGVFISSGNSFSTPPLTINTTYLVESKSISGCLSNRVPIPVTILQSPVISDRQVCSSGFATLVPISPTGTSFRWYNTTGPAIHIGPTFDIGPVNSNISYFVQSDNGSGCLSSRTLFDVTILNLPASPIINNKNICVGTSTNLSPTGPSSVSFKWYDSIAGGNLLFTGPVFSTPVLMSSKTYFVESENSNSCKSARVPVSINVFNYPIFSLGNDTSLCAGQTLTLTQNIAGVNYTWSDGTTNNSITVNTSGTYWLEIDNGSCTGRDSIDINISTSGLSVNLGNDTSLCAGQTLTLTQNIAGVSYTWSDGTTNNSITVNTSGTYWLEIDNGSCTGRDSIDIIISTSGLSLNLGNDTSLCAGQTLTLTQNIAGVNYTWSDGTTNNSITVNTSGTYWLEIDNGSCTGRDSIDIIISTSGLSLNLGNDTSLCAGQTLTLTQNIAGVNYTWSDGTTNNSITVNTSGTYWLEIDNGSCTGRDSIDIIISTSGLSVNLGNDTSLCAGQTLTLTQNIAGVNYTWSDGTTNNSITVNTSGTYWLEIDNGSCTGRDSIDIIISTSGLSVNLGNDTSLCAGQTLTLTQNIAGVSYTWSDGTTNNSITVNTSGTYWLEIDNGSCTGRDSIDIIISTSGLSLNLGNDTSLCAGQTLTLTQNIAGSVIHGVMAQQIIALR
ncbi:MAG: hypothetical protein IPP53_03960 [Bacteroidetes bacterium]|nr:hypothetical protein [Bacteroidota bacterium]